MLCLTFRRQHMLVARKIPFALYACVKLEPLSPQYMMHTGTSEIWW